MTNKVEKIEDKIDRFFEGQTSNEDEQTLYRFFAQENIPEHLRRYKSVFSYFESGLADESTTAPQPAVRNTSQLFLRRRIVWTGVAAAALIGVALCVSYWKAADFDPYEGSYIVRDGVRMTNIKRIRPELEKTLRNVMQEQLSIECQLSESYVSEDLFDRYVKEMKSQQNAIIGEITDPYIREEARKVLNASYSNF